MKTLRLTPEIITIWALSSVTLMGEVLTKNPLFLIPLFLYIFYKSVKGIFSPKKRFFKVSFFIIAFLSFVVLYKATASSLRTLPNKLSSEIIK
jgi:hypothetical protein